MHSRTPQPRFCSPQPPRSSAGRTKAGLALPSALVPLSRNPRGCRQSRHEPALSHPPSRRRGSPALPSAAPPPRAAAPSRRPPLLLGKNEASSSPARPPSQKTRNWAGGSRRRPPPSHPIPPHAVPSSPSHPAPPYAILPIPPHPPQGSGSQMHLCPHPHTRSPPHSRRGGRSSSERAMPQSSPRPRMAPGRSGSAAAPRIKAAGAAFPSHPPALQPALQPPALGGGGAAGCLLLLPFLQPGSGMRLGYPGGGALGSPAARRCASTESCRASKEGRPAALSRQIGFKLLEELCSGTVGVFIVFIGNPASPFAAEPVSPEAS